MLRYGALATPCYENLTGLQKWRVDNGFTPVAEDSVAPDLSNWTPRSKLGGGPPTAQRITEVNLKEKFTFIIIGILAPFAAMIPFMAKHMEKTDRWDHWKKLVGKARYSRLKNVARMLRKLISLCPNILPPAENLVRDLLGKTNDQKKSPTVIMSYWQVLVWISKNFGTYDPDSARDLVNEIDSIQDSVGNVLTMAEKGAKSLTMDAAKALESVACVEPLQPVRCAAATFLFDNASSGRLNNLQHAPPISFVSSDKTLDPMANQDKNRSVPLIAARHCFTGKPWCSPAEVLLRDKRYSEPCRLEDYCLPAPAAVHQGFLQTPCASHTALSLFTSLLQQGGLPAEEAAEFTLASMRMWMHDLAHQANNSADRRRYLGECLL
ncbi:unnamed protein product [Polarella glacialis]|uniref:Uncharacterized protein n=1 Tax=Polarella glacialis TaxID=89957 RepID=A0A813DY79_POLGL|nr:unnamed protein product [Polarella glacialis]